MEKMQRDYQTEMEKIKREKQTALRNIRNTANLPSKKEREEIEKI